MGASRTPELYECAVSINSVSDLKAMIEHTRTEHGRDSDIYDYVTRQMGDPKKDAERIWETSPIAYARMMNMPLLLIHGADDSIVPVTQSRAFSEALKENHKTVVYVELDGVNHSLKGRIPDTSDWDYGFKTR